VKINRRIGVSSFFKASEVVYSDDLSSRSTRTFHGYALERSLWRNNGNRLRARALKMQTSHSHVNVPETEALHFADFPRNCRIPHTERRTVTADSHRSPTRSGSSARKRAAIGEKLSRQAAIPLEIKPDRVSAAIGFVCRGIPDSRGARSRSTSLANNVFLRVFLCGFLSSAIIGEREDSVRYRISVVARFSSFDCTLLVPFGRCESASHPSTFVSRNEGARDEECNADFLSRPATCATHRRETRG